MAEMVASKMIKPRQLPAELLNEIFASLPFENAFGILAKMPNQLLARNVRKMLKSVQMVMRNHKWNEADCGPEMAISEGGLVANYSCNEYIINCVRSILPIPSFINSNAKKPSIAAYFEVQNCHRWHYIGIGFCTKQFSLKGKILGHEENSIGMNSKYGMLIDGKFKKFGNVCSENGAEVVIGIGIVYNAANCQMKCFATWNGELLDTIELPTKFTTLQLYPALTLRGHYNSLRTNFRHEKWRFNITQMLK